MKKYLFAIAALAMIFATSCKKENINEPQSGEDTEVYREPEANEFCAEIAEGSVQQNIMQSINGGMTTKTHFGSNNLDVIWDNGDKIHVNTDANSFSCSVSSTDAKKRAYFANEETDPQTGKPKSYSANSYHAFYGPITNIDTTNANNVSGIFSGSHTYYATKPISNLPMYAYSTNHWLTFKNICGVLKIYNSWSNATSIVVEADKKINGPFTIAKNSASPKMTIDQNGSGTNSITLESDDDALPTGNIYIAIPEGSYNLNIKFYEGNTLLWQTGLSTSSYSVAANKIHNVNLEGAVKKKSVCFTAIENCSVQMGNNSTSTYCYLNYTKFSSAGVESGIFLDENINTHPVSMNSGDRLYIYAANGKTNATFSSDPGYAHRFNIKGRVNVSGKILHLVNENLTTAENSVTDRTFNWMFSAENIQVDVVDASGLILPSKTTASMCAHMFAYCTTLVNGPFIPVQTQALATNCFSTMFEGCTSLTSLTMLAGDSYIPDAGSLYDWLKNAGTNSSVLKVHDCYYSQQSSSTLGTIISNTPTNWTIHCEHYTSPSWKGTKTYP